MSRTTCTEPQCLYSSAIRPGAWRAVGRASGLSACTVELYLYSPYGPYGLYRASVPVQGCTLSYSGKYALNIIERQHFRKPSYLNSIVISCCCRYVVVPAGAVARQLVLNFNLAVNVLFHAM
jgi:hypothetical protein